MQSLVLSIGGKYNKTHIPCHQRGFPDRINPKKRGEKKLDFRLILLVFKGIIYSRKWIYEIT